MSGRINRGDNLNAAEPQPYFQTSVAEPRLAVSHEAGAKPPSEQ
jgi:hypothetical protein